MSIDKVDNNIYRFNGYSNYPQMSTPTMRVVDNHVQPQTNNTQYSNLSPLSNDTVSISASDQIKGSNSKKGMSTLTRVGLTALGIGATAYACLVGHRMMTKPSFETVQKNFSEIFGKDFSKEETTQLIEKYKSICKNNDSETYLKELFKQVKKDMGYGDIDIEFGTKLKDGVNGNCNVYTKSIDVRWQGKEKSFDTMIHEFRHYKQHELTYRAEPEIAINSAISELKGKEPELIKKIEHEPQFKQMIERMFKDNFGNLPRLDKNSSDYEKALKYAKEFSEYKDFVKGDAFDEYHKQLVEKEAREYGAKARQIYNYFASPWRI